MARAGLDTDAVVAAAAQLADADGLEAVTLARLATTLGVRSPSLYAHVDGLADLTRRLAVRGARELAAELQKAIGGRSGSDALGAMADAYRAYARAHSGTYAALQRAPARDDADAAGAAAGVVEVVLAVLRGYDLEGDDAIHATRIIRAALHGFVTLEIDGGFAIPLAIDDSYARLVDVLDHGLSRP